MSTPSTALFLQTYPSKLVANFCSEYKHFISEQNMCSVLSKIITFEYFFLIFWNILKFMSMRYKYHFLRGSNEFTLPEFYYFIITYLCILYSFFVCFDIYHEKKMFFYTYRLKKKTISTHLIQNFLFCLNIIFLQLALRLFSKSNGVCIQTAQNIEPSSRIFLNQFS